MNLQFKKYGLTTAVFTLLAFSMLSTTTVKAATKFEHDLWYTPARYGSDENVVAQLIEEQLEATGYFDINLQSAEWTAYRGQFSTMGFFLLGWWFDYPDPSNYIDPFVGSGAVSLGSNYSTTTMDGYIDTMLTNTDAAARAQAVKDAQDLMAEDVPVIPLNGMLKQFGAMQSDVTGFVLEPSENVHYNSISVSGTELVIGVTDSIPNLDPADAYDYFSSNTLVQLTHGLMEMPVDSTDAVNGPITDSMTVSTSGLNYTFNLKSGITFSDGEAFDADAMKWNLDRARTLNGQPGFLLGDVIESVESDGALELKINLNSADATFIQKLVYTVAWPVSPLSLSADEIGGTSTSIPAGLGPYMVDSWTPDTELILVDNPTYFGTAPTMKKIIVKFYSDASALLTALESGEVDIAQRQFGPDEITAIKANTNLKFADKETAGIRYLVINVDMITEKAVRQAMSLAIDRDEIVSTVYDNLNEPIYTMVPKIFTASKDSFENGPNQAKIAELMEGAGYSKDSDEDGLPIGLWVFTATVLLSLTFVNKLRWNKK